MISVFFFGVLFTLIGGLLVLLDRESDSSRLAEARWQLRQLGLRLPKGSPEELRAVRMLLEGGRPDSL